MQLGSTSCGTIWNASPKSSNHFCRISEMLLVLQKPLWNSPLTSLMVTGKFSHVKKLEMQGGQSLWFSKAFMSNRKTIYSNFDYIEYRPTWFIWLHNKQKQWISETGFWNLKPTAATSETSLSQVQENYNTQIDKFHCHYRMWSCEFPAAHHTTVPELCLQPLNEGSLSFMHQLVWVQVYNIQEPKREV